MDNFIYSIAYWLQGRVKSTTIIKLSLIAMLVSIPFGLIFGEIIILLTVILAQGVTLVLEFFYARNEEIAAEARNAINEGFASDEDVDEVMSDEES